MRLPLLLLAVASAHLAGVWARDGDVTQIESDAALKALSSSGPVLVEFYAPWCGHCKALDPEWERAAKALKGMLAVAAVDADKHRDLGSAHGVQGFPTIKLFYTDPKTGKLKSTDYSGARTAMDIVKWGLQQATGLAVTRLGGKPGGAGRGEQGGGGAGAGGGGGGGGKCGSGGGGGGGGGSAGGFYGGTDVVELDDANFHSLVGNSDDLWFVEMYAPWCGHCKNLKPDWIELAQQLGGRVKVGAVDCTTSKQTCDEFGVRGFPTIKWFGENKERPEDYGGGRDAASLAAFATERWSRSQPPPQVRELTDETLWEEHCVGHPADPDLDLKEQRAKQLCLVAFLPHILDSKAAGRQAYIKILQGLTALYKDRPFSYFWAEGGAQPALEANFGVGGYGYPALVALNPKKGKFASLRSAFEEAHVKEFLENVRLNFERVADVEGPLAQVATRPAWDGSDGEEFVEEEFSLDDIMGDDDGEEGSKDEL